MVNENERKILEDLGRQVFGETLPKCWGEVLRVYSADEIDKVLVSLERNKDRIPNIENAFLRKLNQQREASNALQGRTSYAPQTGNRQKHSSVVRTTQKLNRFHVQPINRDGIRRAVAIFREKIKEIK